MANESIGHRSDALGLPKAHTSPTQKGVPATSPHLAVELGQLLVLVGFVCASGCASIPVPKQVQPRNAAPAVLWRDPGEMATLNMFYGAGGPEHAPNANGIF